MDKGMKVIDVCRRMTIEKPEPITFSGPEYRRAIAALLALIDANDMHSAQRATEAVFDQDW